MNRYIEKIARRKFPDEDDLKTLYGHVSNAKALHDKFKAKKRPKKPGHVKKSAAGTDFVKMDTPLLIRALEHAREDIKSDEELHKFVERMLDAQKNRDSTMGMEVYDKIK